jgi:hypothetical protein
VKPLLGRNQHFARLAVVSSVLADHPAHGFAAFPAVYRGFVVRMHRTGRASARRDGVVHFRRIQSPAHADDHANHLQQLRTIVNRDAAAMPWQDVAVPGALSLHKPSPVLRRAPAEDGPLSRPDANNPTVFQPLPENLSSNSSALEKGSRKIPAICPPPPGPMRQSASTKEVRDETHQEDRRNQTSGRRRQRQLFRI